MAASAVPGLFTAGLVQSCAGERCVPFPLRLPFHLGPAGACLAVQTTGGCVCVRFSGSELVICRKYVRCQLPKEHELKAKFSVRLMASCRAVVLVTH